MCKSPFAYGGPSCSTNGLPPSIRFFSSRFRYVRCSAHHRTRSGSRLGNSPRIGKSVLGKLRVAR